MHFFLMITTSRALTWYSVLQYLWIGHEPWFFGDPDVTIYRTSKIKPPNFVSPDSRFLRGI